MFEVALVDSGSVIGGTGEALRLGVADGDPGTGEPGTGESGNFGDPISMEISSVLCGKFAVVEGLIGAPLLHRLRILALL